jgi:geranylgeranyl reductase
MSLSSEETFDVVVVGGGPSGATAAEDLARAGRSVMLLDRAGRIKPCGGAIPPRLMKDFEIPESVLVARATSARMIAPSDREVDMPIEGGYVGMVDREAFDEWLRVRAAKSGAVRRTGVFDRIERDADGVAVVCYRAGAHRDATDDDGASGAFSRVRARTVIGADGARSQVARQTLKGADKVPCVFAYHEIVRAPRSGAGDFDGRRCDVFYQGKLSPDFYAWIFPHGDTASIGVGSARKGFSLRGAIKSLRADQGLAGCETIRREGAAMPRAWWRRRRARGSTTPWSAAGWRPRRSRRAWRRVTCAPCVWPASAS